MSHLAISFDNSILVTGGEDTVARVFTLSKDMKSHEKKLELAHANGPICSVDISRDNRLVVCGSKDGTAYICDLTKKGEAI